MSDKFDINQIIIDAHEHSYQRAFELAVRTSTALIFWRDGKIIEEKPPYRYELVPIKPSKRSKPKTRRKT
jgi:hypothetical protein